MAKQTSNPIELKVVLHFDSGMPVYHIDDVSIHYGMTCEHGLNDRTGLPLEQNQEILNIVKDFIEEGMKQVDTHEEIPEEDSMMDYNGAPDNLTQNGETI